MKTVFTNRMVAHVWAQRNQEYGRSNNGQLYFRGRTIYSYRDSWPLATFLNNGKVLFNAATYSPTTSKHLSYVRQAVNGTAYENRISIDSPDIVKTVSEYEATNSERHKEYALTDLERIAKELIKRSVENALNTAAERRMARKKKEDIDGALYSINAIASVYENIGLFVPQFVVEARDALQNDVDSLIKNHAAELQAAKEKADKERAEREARLKVLAEKCLEAWLRGIDKILTKEEGLLDCVSYMRDMKEAWLRVRGDNIETSQGASFPVTHAKKAFEHIRIIRNNKGEYNRIVSKENLGAIRLGHFQIDHVAANGDVKAGCHFVPWPAIENVARELAIYP